MTMKAKIRDLLKKGFHATMIAPIVGCSVNYVCATRWIDLRRGYNANWMQEKRTSDPAYAEREREQQAEYKRRRRRRR